MRLIRNTTTELMKMPDFRRFLEMQDEITQSRYEKIATPAEFVNLFHTQSDIDAGPFSMHHSLGIGPFQATAGTHIHDGKTSRKLEVQRVATDIQTGSSVSVTTTETIVQSVTAPVVIGRTYRITSFSDYLPTAAGVIWFVKIREDDVVGNNLDFRRFLHPTNTNYPYRTEVEYTAVATEDKTFVLTLIRSGASGSCTRRGVANAPSYFYVDYIRG